MSNKYKEMMSKVVIPPGLKEATLQKIRDEKRAQQDFSEDNIPKKKDGKVFSLSNMLKMTASLAAAVLVVVVGARLLLPSSSIITNLEAGMHTAQVVLKNGELNFATIEKQSFESPANFGGGMGLVKKAWTSEDFAKTYLKTSVFPQPKGYRLIDSDIGAYYESFGDTPKLATGNLHYEGKNGGTLNLILSTNPIPVSATLGVGEKSDIENITVYVGYIPEKHIYMAAFKKENINYYAEGNGLSQREFIEILENLVKNK